jgi:branched-chain amino acid transport system permease protein
MQQVLEYVLLGLSSGALIAFLALGLVVSYRGSGIVNLAMGAVAMVTGYAFWALRTGSVAGVQMGTVPAIICSLLITVFLSGAAELLAFRPLRTSSPLAKLVCSLGVLLIAQSVVVLAFGAYGQNEPNILPTGPVHILGAVVPAYNLVMAGLAIFVAVGLWALYRWTRFGLATRAASENEVAAMLGGLSPNTLSMANTLLGGLVAGSAGILSAALAEIDSSTLPLAVVPALAAALLARFTSFGIACAAGLALGILESLIGYVTSLSWFPTAGGSALPGVEELFVFGVIVLVMYLRGANMPSRGELIERRLPSVPKPGRVARWALIAAVGCGLLMIFLPYDFRQALINTLIGTLLALSLVVITGFVGQISVVQLTLSGVTGFVISHMAVNAGIGFPLAPLIGVVVAIAFGLLAAMSALRVRGVSLAVVTLAAVVAITNFGFDNPVWGVNVNGSSPVASPHLFSLSLGPGSSLQGLDGDPPSAIWGWVVLAVTILLCLFVAWVRRGELGQRMLAVRSNERAAAAAGINPRNIKLLAFGASSMIAGFAGALTAYNIGSVSVSAYDPLVGLSLIAFAYAGGIGLISGAVFAGLISTQALFPYALQKWFGLSGNWFLLFGGVVLIVTLIQNPEGVAGFWYQKLHRRPEIRQPEVVTAGAAGMPDGTPGAASGASQPPPAAAVQRRPSQEELDSRPVVLQVKGLSVAFGGVHAVNDVDLEVRAGELVGLIGPNGAGKTTFIDAITGFVHCSGTVELDGQEISKLAAHDRSRLGLVRTWQGTDLFDDLEVRENLNVAGWKGDEGADDDPLAFVGLDWAAKAMPAELPQGQRKLIGVARALAGSPRVLCLDEPAAGLDTSESQELGRRLRDLADRGQATLLIDHDMGIVLGICDRVVVLEFGQVIAQGAPDVVRDDPRVIGAYLGGGGGGGGEVPVGSIASVEGAVASIAEVDGADGPDPVTED